MSDLKNKLKGFFLIKDGEKERLNIKSIGQISLAFFVVAIVVSAFTSGTNSKGHSVRTDKKIVSPKKDKEESPEKPDEVFQTAAIADNKPSKAPQREPITSKSIDFQAKQVIERGSEEGSHGSLPTGTNMIGKLLTAIDTRNLSSTIKVLLPYGASFNGEVYFEKGTVLIGNANFPGQGERVNMSFDKAVTPEGHEFKVSAHALDSSDYANGVIGDVHSETGLRVAGTLGLTMISGMADVLTEKSAHGESGVVTTKSTMKNAVTHGVSKVAEMEAARQAETMAKTPPYVTIEAGTDVIITLTQSFKESF